MEEVIGRSKVKDFSLLPCILSDQTDVPRAITYRIQKAKKQHYKTILAVEPSRQTEQGKTTDNMEKKFGRGDEGKWSLMEGHYTDGSG